MKKKSKEDKITKKQILKNIMREANKKYSNSTVHFAKDEQKWIKLSTGITEIDELTGGGFAYGRVSVLWGGEAVGKSTLMYHAIVQAQKEGKVIAYLDLENSIEPNRLEKFGINLNKEDLVIMHFPIAENSLDTIIELAKNKAVDVIILDSIHSLSPSKENEDKKGNKSLEDDTMALLARKLSQFFRMASNHVYNANIALIMIGQTRTNLGGFITLQALTGGMSLKHNSVLTLHFRRGKKVDSPTEKYKDEEGKTKHKIIGFPCVIRNDKIQTPNAKPEGTSITLPFYFDTGFKKGETNEKI